MALLAESLVEEWLNRKGFFTIRGLKHGLGEMDVLAVRRESDGSVVGRHVEVQVSFRPIGYIGGGTSARKRTAEEISAGAREWVDKKFRDPAKHALRERLWAGLHWSFHLVHGVLREPQELEVFEAEGVACHPFHELLTALSKRSSGSFSGSAGGDLAEIVSYYKECKPNSASVLRNLPAEP